MVAEEELTAGNAAVGSEEVSEAAASLFTSVGTQDRDEVEDEADEEATETAPDDDQPEVTSAPSVATTTSAANSVLAANAEAEPSTQFWSATDGGTLYLVTIPDDADPESWLQENGYGDGTTYGVFKSLKDVRTEPCSML